MNAVDNLFKQLRAERRRAFIPFLTAGDPDIRATVELIRSVADAGADLIEIGFPFSDPIADGPVIQASYTRALNQGLKVQQVFDAISEAVKTPGFKPPVVGMVSYSLIHRRGPKEFLDAAKLAGLSGLIVPDLVADEADAFADLCRAADMKLILLVTPTTSPERAKHIVSLCSGFVYCVSVVGITGERDKLPEQLTTQLAQLRKMTDLPLCVGFGVSRPDHVVHLKEIADGVIVGSALVKKMEQGGIPAVAQLVRELIAPLKV
ncbi:tryptophan synthase subunit alpha [Zavarzinella formosa]|uniref:tryptophan synthase subunit alpha n=1 Tax=Zavarzinella formosa TaxID=360055 RepID=UPI0002F1EAF5|nr:tryptophan synthase subunit alpha [Zavarzinella formosa]